MQVDFTFEEKVMSLVQGLLLWYTTGLIGSLMVDYVESCIVNRDYDRCVGATITYFGGVRPPAYQVFLASLLGLIVLVIGISSVYNFYKGNYGEFE